MNFIKRGLYNRKIKNSFEKGQNSSGALILKREGNLVISVLRQDNTVFAKGDKVLFRSHIGQKFGPWEITFFNIYDLETTEVKHCSAAFTHTTCYLLSIGLLEHVS